MTTPSLKHVELTGKVTFKKNFFGSLVLWVEETSTYYPNTFDTTFFKTKTYWRKANEIDLLNVKNFVIISVTKF